MRLNPLTYGVEALRDLLYPDAVAGFPLSSAVATLTLFSLVMFGLALLMANRRSRSSSSGCSFSPEHRARSDFAVSAASNREFSGSPVREVSMAAALRCK